MVRRIAWIMLLGGMLSIGLTACASGTDTMSSALYEVIITPTPPKTQPSTRGINVAANLELATPTPAAQGTPTIPAIRVWWPDELYPHSTPEMENILLSQFEDFRQTYTTYSLEVRRKHSSGQGGILPTLRTAAPVAPGALPDLTLMRRADMVTAATEGLIVPLTDWVPPDLLSDLLPGAQMLGQIDGVLYGLPYALNLYHVVYRTSAFSQPILTFADMLARKPSYLFPAGSTPVTWTVLLQYQAAGGRLVDENGSAILDRDPLLTVLNYYAQGVKAGLFDPTLLGYVDFDGYWNQFLSTGIDMAAVDSVTYLSRKGSLHRVGLAPIPTADGKPITVLDGWVWVLVTQDADHQARSRAFLSWMMRISEQSLFTEALGILPSQKRALRLWDDQDYAGFAQEIMPYAQVIPDTQRGNSAAAALQGSLVAVLQGTPAEVAADAALQKLGK